MMRDQLNQALYGPTSDKLKYAGTAWLALSLIANFGRADLGGFVGLLAVLAVVSDSEYLLRLFLVFAPLSVLVGLVFFFEHVWSLAWLCLQFLHFLIQVASIWFAYQYYQELGGVAADSYAVPNGSPGGEGHRPQQARNDPFQAYIPPAQSNLYQQGHPQQLPPQQQHNEHPINQEGQGQHTASKSDNLI